MDGFHLEILFHSLCKIWKLVLTRRKTRKQECPSSHLRMVLNVTLRLKLLLNRHRRCHPSFSHYTGSGNLPPGWEAGVAVCRRSHYVLSLPRHILYSCVCVCVCVYRWHLQPLPHTHTHTHSVHCSLYTLYGMHMYKNIVCTVTLYYTIYSWTRIKDM